MNAVCSPAFIYDRLSLPRIYILYLQIVTEILILKLVY